MRFPALRLSGKADRGERSGRPERYSDSQLLRESARYRFDNESFHGSGLVVPVSRLESLHFAAGSPGGIVAPQRAEYLPRNRFAGVQYGAFAARRDAASREDTSCGTPDLGRTERSACTGFFRAGRGRCGQTARAGGAVRTGLRLDDAHARIVHRTDSLIGRMQASISVGKRSESDREKERLPKKDNNDKGRNSSVPYRYCSRRLQRQVLFDRIAQVIALEMGVDFGGQDALVPQHLLHLTDRSAPFEQMRSERMTEGVGTDQDRFFLQFFRQTYP